MGMGEPFYNYDNVKMAVEILKDKEGLIMVQKKLLFQLLELQIKYLKLQMKLELI